MMDTIKQLLCVGLLLMFAVTASAEEGPKKPEGGASQVEATNDLPKSVFAMFAVRQQRIHVMGQILALLQQRRYAELETGLTQLVKSDRVPGTKGDDYYNLACVQAQRGKKDEALKSLDLAVGGGFLDHAHMLADPDLVSLRTNPGFKAIVSRARDAAGASKPLTFKQGALTLSLDPNQSFRGEPFAAGPIRDGLAHVTEANSLWVPGLGMILVVYRFDPADPRKDAPIAQAQDAVGTLLRGWQKEGTAAGLWGVIYDNHDRGHSNLDTAKYPQLTRLAYGEQARHMKLDNGLQAYFLHTAEPTNGWKRGCIVLGNTSEAVTGGPFWRSLPRLALNDPQGLQAVSAHYLANHISFYPEHADHDPGLNGQGGYGDTFPANTPYFIISQGSSGSDQAFLNAAVCTIAAFRPETRLALEQKGLIAGAVQMILRMSNKTVTKPEEYLTGRAHPSVFEGGQLDVEKMVKMAHEMNAGEIPGLAILTVKEETKARAGVDYMSPFPEQLFDSTCAIARVARSMDFERRMVVSAESSEDPNGRPLRFRWVVLRGDAEAIRIQPLNGQGSLAEIRIPYHTRRPVLPGAPIESRRVDIGVFTHNGAYYSAPSFVSVLFLDNETRVYDGTRIQSVEYKSRARGGNYTDPGLEYVKDWKDEYRQDDQGRLLGWTRTMPDGKKTEYTAEGDMVLSRDGQGRVKETAKVRYNVKQSDPDQVPILEPLVVSDTIGDPKP
jgi:hypothetical protein